MDNQEHNHNACGPSGCGNQKHNMENHGHKCACGSNCNCGSWYGNDCKCGNNCNCGCKFGRDCTCGEKCGCFQKDTCMVCGAFSHKKYKIVRILLLIALLCFTFWMGEMVGKFRGEFGWNYYYGQGNNCGMMNNNSYGRMNNKNNMPMYYRGSDDGYNIQIEQRAAPSQPSQQMMQQRYRVE